VGFTVSDPGARAAPESGRFSVESEALLVSAIFPLTWPDACGANNTLKVVFWPEVRVNGKLIPLKLKPDPVTEAWVTDTVEPPELLSVTN
jgi:hypothetical protein